MQTIAAIVAGFLLGIGISTWRSRRSRRELLAFLQRLGWSDMASAPLDDRQLTLVLKHLSDQKTQLHHHEANLQARLGAYDDFLEHLPVGFLLVDRHNLLLQCNQAARELFQLRQWQPQQRVLLEWIRSYELDRLIQSVRQERATHPHAQSLPPVTQAWSYYPADSPDTPIPLRAWAADLGGGTIGTIVEPRQEATAQEQQQNRWTTDVAHELKTPLTSIRLVAETLHKRIPPDLQSWTEGMLGEVTRLSALVQDLLELSYLDRQVVLNCEEVELVSTLHEAWASLAPLAQRKGQHLIYDGPDRLSIQGDPQRLHRLWLNLLDNAIEFNQVDAPIRVTLEANTTHAIANAIDCGSGFASEEVCTRIFERFYRADEARARSNGGTGLGLAIARQIVELHGGTITARNSPDTGGACLHFTLARRDVTQLPPQSSHPPEGRAIPYN